MVGYIVIEILTIRARPNVWSNISEKLRLFYMAFPPGLFQYNLDKENFTLYLSSRPLLKSLTKPHTESVSTKSSSKFPEKQLNHPNYDEKEEVVQAKQHVVSARPCFKGNDWWRCQTGWN